MANASGLAASKALELLGPGPLAAALRGAVALPQLAPNPKPSPPCLPPGVPKHHICNANLMKNGADFAVYLNTAQEFDGSDSGGRGAEQGRAGRVSFQELPFEQLLLHGCYVSRCCLNICWTSPGARSGAGAGGRPCWGPPG